MKKQSSIPHRGLRVAEQIQRDLGELIAREIKDPRVGMVTVTGVSVSPDYAHAKVYFSQIMGDKDACLVGLQKSSGYLRTLLFKRLQIHTVPTLHFEYDSTSERAADMNALIARAVAPRSESED